MISDSLKYKSVKKILKGVTRWLLLSFLNTKLFFIQFLLIFISNHIIYSQDNNLFISLKGNYTTTSRYYPSNVIVTSYSYEEYFSIDDLFGFGVEARYKFSDFIALGISGESVSGSINYTHHILKLPAKAGYDMLLFELNGYYYMPLSTHTFKFYIGGGIGFAYGMSYEELPTIRSQIISSPVNTGIQVVSGMEYYLYKDFLIRFEMKFRDPIVENESKYTTSRINYNGRIYNVSTKPFKSKVNIDGLVFDFSIAYQIF